jgi:hypothetical protein
MVTETETDASATETVETPETVESNAPPAPPTETEVGEVTEEAGPTTAELLAEISDGQRKINERLDTVETYLTAATKTDEGGDDDGPPSDPLVPGRKHAAFRSFREWREGS